MMKNKKIISLICALAMVFSMFSAFTVVNAENTKGINIEGTLSADGTEITLVAKSVGTTAKINSYGIKVNVPDGVTNENVTATAQQGVTLISNVANGVLGLTFSDAMGVEFKDNVLATAVIKLSAPLSSDYVVTLQNDAMLEDADGIVRVQNGSMDASTTTVAKWQDPNKKPDTVERPAEDTTEEPDVPTPVDPTGKGIALEVSLDKTNTTLTIVAKSVGTTAKINSYGIKVNVPDGVTNENVTATAQQGVTLISNVANGVLGLTFSDAMGVEFKDNVLATAVIELPVAATAPIAVTLQNDAMLEDADGIVRVQNGSMTATTAVATPSGEEFTGKTTPLKNYVGAGYEDAINALPEGTDVYLTVDVKKADGTEATYGVDYVAVYKDKQLTAKEYNNLIHGYTDEDMVDVINGLTFVYDSSVVKMISTTLNAVGYESQLVDPVTDKTIGTTTPTNFKKPTLTVSPATKTVYPGDKVTIKPTLKENDAKDGVLTVEISENATDYVMSLATDEDTKAVSFKAALKGTVTVTYTYAYKDADDKEAKLTDTSKITIKEKADNDNNNNSSSSSNSSGNGPIAGPAGSVTPIGGTIGGTSFQDLGDVVWAQEAIYALAAKNIVSGRDEYTFDPNANITRAEYCQILIGAINKTSEYADSSFADVPTDAWFYHAVAVASKYGIVSGYGDGNFGPYDLITRQDMALMTYKAAQVMGTNLAAVSPVSFADADQVAPYAAEAVQTLADAGIINGMGDGTFAPIANATRAQAAVILYTTFVK